MPKKTLGKIAVLGAGNGNDIDLNQLCERFEEVHLIDLDEAAIDRALENVTANIDRLHLHAPFDIAAPLASGELNSGLMDGSAVPVEQCDIVVSSGLLSQLFLTGHQLLKNALTQETQDVAAPDDSAVENVSENTSAAVGADVPLEAAVAPAVSELEMLQWIRRGHWNTVQRMLRPGGSLVLTLDFVSSDTATELLRLNPAQFGAPALQPLASRLLQTGNFFSGMNPGVVLAELQQRNIALVETTLPWIWDLGPRRYLVMGLVADF